MNELSPLEAGDLISSLPAAFAERVNTCLQHFDYFAQAGLLLPEMYVGRSVLDWEAGDCAWSICFLLRGARHVTATDSWGYAADIASDALRHDPRFAFSRSSAEEFLSGAGDGVVNHYDLVFANTVTEHIQNLPPAFNALRRMLRSDGVFFVNHDNYYSPCGSHDHGFWFYGDYGNVKFQGAECWEHESKCEASAQHRASLRQNLPWTWTEEQNSRLDPSNCPACPYYKRSRPWAHLIWIEEFVNVFDSQVFSTGRSESTLNKITCFQLLQFLSEAGFRVFKSNRVSVNNVPPQELIDMGFSVQDLTTSTFCVLSSPAATAYNP